MNTNDDDLTDDPGDGPGGDGPGGDGPGGDGLEAVALLDNLPCTNSALRRAARQLGYLYDEAMAPVGLKATQLALLARIDELGGTDGPTLQALADRLAIRLSALTHALRPLVRDGLIALRQNAQDKRIKHAALTELGRRSLADGGALWSATNHRVELVLGPDSAALLRALAEQIASRDFLDAFKAGRALSTAR